MNKKFLIGISLLILFTTFVSQTKYSNYGFKIKEIIIKNNHIIDKKKLLKDLSFLYNENLIFTKNSKIRKKLTQYSFIEGFNLKKKYPDKLEIEVIEKKPIAIIITNGQKYFLGKKIELIDYRDLVKFQDLPLVYGDKESFKIFYNNLKKINFTINLIKKYSFFETKRWDLEMSDKKIIKLPTNNYRQSLNNFLEIKDNRNFDIYKVFDYRLDNQLILK